MLKESNEFLELRSLADCEQLLWKSDGEIFRCWPFHVVECTFNDTGSQKARRKVEDNLRLFDSTFDWVQNPSLRYVVVCDSLSPNLLVAFWWISSARIILSQDSTNLVFSKSLQVLLEDSAYRKVTGKTQQFELLRVAVETYAFDPVHFYFHLDPLQCHHEQSIRARVCCFIVALRSRRY